MLVVPVIDLKEGKVVQARLGRRDDYRPIVTPLASSSRPADVSGGLLRLHPFKTMYIADLDAIEGRGDNQLAIERLAVAFPSVTFWVDNGIGTVTAAAEWLARGIGHLVLGSEAQNGTALLRHFAHDPRLILSLDFRGDDFQGPLEILADPSIWPARVIGMTLARVGSGAGPDLERLFALHALAPDRELFAAGGVRSTADLRELRSAGVSGALVATSLHDGRLTSADIETLGADDVETPEAETP